MQYKRPIIKWYYHYRKHKIEDGWFLHKIENGKGKNGAVYNVSITNESNSCHVDIP